MLLLKFLKKNNYLKRFIYKLIPTLAFTATIGGFVLVFFPLNVNGNINKLYVLITFLVFNVAFVFIWAKPIKKLTVKLTDRIKVNVCFGDILECTENIVIPFNSDFDTKVDDIKISTNSLHGSFINRLYASNVEKLEIKIREQLKKQERQKLGTTLKIEEKGNKYFLVALSNLDIHNKAHTTLEEYHDVLIELLSELHNHSQGKTIHMPLIGAGLSGVDLSKQELLEYLLMQIKINKNLNFNSGLTIVLHSSLSEEISLERIDAIYNRI